MRQVSTKNLVLHFAEEIAITGFMNNTEESAIKKGELPNNFFKKKEDKDRKAKTSGKPGNYGKKENIDKFG